MMQAYSRLKRVLSERKITVPELYRRIRQRGVSVNLKSLYRLSNDQQPLQRLDLRVAGAVCEVCEVPLSELITFEEQRGRLLHFPTAKQKRLDVLMAKNNEGRLTSAEQEELQALVREAEEMTLVNARMLREQREQLTMR